MIVQILIIAAGWVAACLLFLAALVLNFRREDRERQIDCQHRIRESAFERRQRGTC